MLGLAHRTAPSLIVSVSRPVERRVLDSGAGPLSISIPNTFSPYFHRYKRLCAVVLILVLLLLLFHLSGLKTHFSLSALRDLILANRLRGVVLFIVLFALGNLVQVPGWVFLAAAVLALGQGWGAVLTYGAALVSCIFTFVTIRLLGGAALRQLKNRFAQRILTRLDTHPVSSVLLLRLICQTAPALNYVLAMSGVSFRKYVLGTVLGLPLPIIVYCVFFEYIDRLLGVSAALH
jgi:uncharacterized membrane protein YdjX (TVP38/TMEM64 family)